MNNNADKHLLSNANGIPAIATSLGVIISLVSFVVLARPWFIFQITGGTESLLANSFAGFVLPIVLIFAVGLGTGIAAESATSRSKLLARVLTPAAIYASFYMFVFLFQSLDQFDTVVMTEKLILSERSQVFMALGQSNFDQPSSTRMLGACAALLFVVVMAIARGALDQLQTATTIAGWSVLTFFMGLLCSGSFH